MLFGKKYKCFGCKIKIKKYSKVVGIKEIGMFGLSYLHIILCDTCAKRIHNQVTKLLIQKVKRVFHIEDSIHNK